MKRKLQVVIILALVSAAAIGTPVFALEKSEPSAPASSPGFTLDQSIMCEDIRDFLPYNGAVVFSLEIGKVYCFSSFSGISEKIFVYHDWYRQDRLITTKRLQLQPPEWATYSSIQLREADKGPWRVEMKDQTGQVIQILRFSITD